jgi:transcription elongation factor Elf1
VNTIPHPDIPARSFSCPQCSAQHSRGTVNGVDVYRCLKCGWSGRLDKKGRAILPLHCPFCGRDRTGLLDVHGEFEHVQVHCLHCHATGPQKSTDGRAVQAWNKATRPSLAFFQRTLSPA